MADRDHASRADKVRHPSGDDGGSGTAWARQESYTIPAYAETQIPDGGRWLIVYHDGDEESVVHHEISGRFIFGPTSGSWQVASSGSRDPGLPEGVLDE